jgi:hypothetical protein
MTDLWIRILLMISLPVAVFSAGAFLMSQVSDGDYIEQRLQQLPDYKDRMPLNQRSFGYDAKAVSRHWSAFDSTALDDQRRALEVDLVFPLLYGAAFLTTFLLGWVTLGRPFHFCWLIAPVAITILADWTENSFQLGQLQNFGRTPLSESCIRLASAGTIVKLLFFKAMIVIALLLAVWASLRPADHG